MSFEDIKGQDSALLILKENINNARVFSSYLFVGPDGIGKKEAAKNFAKAINCLNDRMKPCDICVPCKKINSGIHPDVFLVTPKGASASIGIDEIREVISRANLKPYEGKKKVFIIEGAHSMTAESANAFLKTLEEPPRDTVFILLSRSKELVLPTIISRCNTVKFFTAPPETVKRVLMERFSAKGEPFEKDEARILSGFSSGRIGEAIRMKEKNLIARKNKILDSVTGVDFRDKLSAYSDKRELKENMEFIVSYLRDIFLYKATQDERTALNSDRISEIKTMSAKLQTEKIDYLIKKVIKLSSYVDYNVNPKIVIDVLCNEVKEVFTRYEIQDTRYES